MRPSLTMQRPPGTPILGPGTPIFGPAMVLVCSQEDFEGEGDDSGLESVPEVLARLDGITGLESVKVYIKQLMAQLTMRQQRKEAGLPVPADSSLHMIFSGNPGTGKSTPPRTALRTTLRTAFRTTLRTATIPCAPYVPLSSSALVCLADLVAVES